MSTKMLKPGRVAGRILVVWIAALAFALSLWAGTVAPAYADAPAPAKNTAKYEVDFIQDMIDHHAMAVMMAEVCLDKAIHEELRSMCEDITAAQTQEIATMQAWLQAWYGISYEPQMSPGDHKMVERLAELEGEEFEIEFMQTMIKHHAKAIKEASQCVERAYHPELMEMCHNIIVTQQAEIEQMQAWLCEWYGICKE